MPTKYADLRLRILGKREKSNFERGKGYWIFNNSLLEDQNYTKGIENLWINWRAYAMQYDSVGEWWEEGKKEIKKFTKYFCKNKTAEQNKRKNSIRKRLRNIYKKIKEKPELQNMANNLKGQLYEIEVKEAEGAKIRAK